MADKTANGRKPTTEIPVLGGQDAADTGFRAPPSDDAQAPRIAVRAQYVKDLSFENPHAPESLMEPAGSPQIQVNVRLESKPLGSDLYEVALRIEASARRDDRVAFLVELGVRRSVRAGAHPARAGASRVHGRVRPAVVPVRAAGDRRRDARGRLPAAVPRSDRFRPPVSRAAGSGPFSGEAPGIGSPAQRFQMGSTISVRSRACASSSSGVGACGRGSRGGRRRAARGSGAGSSPRSGWRPSISSR